MLITNLSTGRVFAAVVTMGALTAMLPVCDLRDFAGGATGRDRSAAPRGGRLKAAR